MWIWRYKGVKGKNKTRAPRKNFTFDFFFSIEFVFVFFLRFLNIVCPDQNHFFTLTLQEKIAKFELSHQKKVLDECSSTLEFFLEKYVHISILVS